MTIPSILHHIWFSGDEFRFNYWRSTWMKHHPDWTFMFWTLDNFPMHKIPPVCAEMLLNPDLHWVLKSDIARFLVLWMQGGVYSDTDMQCCKSIAPFMESSSFAAFSCTPRIVGNSLVGCEKGNLLMLEIACAMAAHISCGIKHANENICDHGANFAGKMLHSCELLLPYHYFYPFGSGDRDHRSDEFPDSYCIHHWSGMDKNGWYNDIKNKKGNTKN